MATPETDLQEQRDEAAQPSVQQVEQELSIGRRVANWKTAASFGFAVFVLVFAIAKAGIDPAAMWSRIRSLNPILFFGAFVIYYLTFPLRGYRWKVLLQNAYRGPHAEAVDEMSILGLTEIVYISWFVNCVVPAKLGDLYRAYLAKLWVHISWTKTIGTVLAERILDVLVIGVMLAGTGFVVFHNRLGQVSVLMLFGVGLGAAAIVVLVAMKTMSRRIQSLLPERFLQRYIAFEEGSLNSFQRIPLLIGLTMAIWLLEAARLQVVFTALGLKVSVSGIPFAPVLFFALGTAVLTTVPFAPGGLGLVEVGLSSIMIYLGIHKSDAAVVVLLDRLITYYSVAFFGFLVYLLGERSHLRHPV